MEKQKQMKVNLFEDFISAEKDAFISTTKSLKKSISRLRSSIPERIEFENVKTTKNSYVNLLAKIKNEGDILGLLPSANILIKYFDGLDSLAKASNLNLADDDDSKFLQRFYKFFIKAPKNIGFSKDNKELILKDRDTILEVYNLDKSVGSLSDNDFKAVVQIYKMKIENKNRAALRLAKQYKGSPLFRRNLINIIMIHNIAFENGFEFDFVNSNIVNLLLISYLNKGIPKKVVAENILSALETLKDGKIIDLEQIFNVTKNSKGELISRKNRDINLQDWLLMKISIGNAQTNQLSYVKEIFSLDISGYQMIQVLGLKIGSAPKREALSTLVSKLNSEKNEIFTKVQTLLS